VRAFAVILLAGCIQQPPPEQDFPPPPPPDDGWTGPTGEPTFRKGSAPPQLAVRNAN